MPISPPNCFDVETSNRRDQEEIGRQLQDDSNQGSAAKADLIAAACAEKNTLALVDLATTPRGLLDDTLRRDAWPLLLGLCTRDQEIPSQSEGEDVIPAWKRLPSHRDEDQVRLDVNRSFVFYPSNESEEQLDRRKIELSDVIVETLRTHPTLCYFQGFHDIVQVILLVLGKELARRAVPTLSLLRIRDFMLPSLSASLAHLKILPAILYAVDPKLHQHLSQTQPFFALAATLTLYAHEIQEYGDIARLFDILLAQEPVVSVYFFAVVILSRKGELFEIPADDPEMLHFTLSKLPKPLDLDDLIQRAMGTFKTHPPQSLPFGVWRRVSQYSVLKNARIPHGENNFATETEALAEGELLFDLHAIQLRREKHREEIKALLWKYRRPASGIGVAMLVGLISIWIQRNHETGLSGMIVKTWGLWPFRKAL